MTPAEATAAALPRQEEAPGRRALAGLGPPLAVGALLALSWHVAARASGGDLVPTPGEVVLAVGELAGQGLLLKYVVASLFRVCWGFGLAVLLGVPLGLALGWYPAAFRALNPVLQLLRPISPIAWIPLAILWFGVKDAAPIFLIFLASVLPIALAATTAVQGIPVVYLRAARNFGLSGPLLVGKVILPAALPQLLTGLRLALGIAWMVVVAAEMIAVTSGLGYLIVDARNAGKRYDLVVAGMLLIGVIGLLLDQGLRRLERLGHARR